MVLGVLTHGKIVHLTTRKLAASLFDSVYKRTRNVPGSLPFLYPIPLGLDTHRPAVTQTCRKFGTSCTVSNDRTEITPTTTSTTINNVEDQQTNPIPETNDMPVSTDSLFSVGRTKTEKEKLLLWRAWLGMSEDLQATRLQLLESLLEMLQTESEQDAYKLKSLLDSKHGLLDSRQRSFYSFWSHMVLQEPDLAMNYYLQLSDSLQVRHWQIFLRKTIETGDWSTAVKLWSHVVSVFNWHKEPLITRLLDLIPNVHTWQFLHVLPPNAAETMRAAITPRILMYLATRGKEPEVIALVSEAVEHERYLGDSALATAMRSLSRDGAHDTALGIYYDVIGSRSISRRTYRSILAALGAAAGLSDILALRTLLATDVLTKLRDAGSGIRLIEPYTTVMAAFARYGETAEVDGLLAEYQSLGFSPDVVMLSAVVHSRVQTLEITKACELFSSCKEKYGVEPDQIIHNVMLHAFTDVLDTEAANNLLTIMLEAGLKPDVYTASILIDLFAHTKDADGAENAFDRMLELGVVPNIQVYGALLHAYVEAEDFDRATKAFEMFRASGIRVNSEIMNILLKQLQKQGSPSQDLTRLVAGMAELGVYSSDTTYTSIMQALISEDKLREALDIFQALKNPNDYHYTVMMVGFIRAGTPESMDALLYYYDEMIDRGFKPSYVTLAVLMNAYVIRNTPESAKRAIALLDSFGNWARVDLSSTFSPRNIPAPDVYGPLFRRNEDGVVSIVDPQNVFKQFLQSIAGTDGRPDVRTLTSIMSIYATGGEINKVRALFMAIKQEADRLYRYRLGEPLGNIPASEPQTVADLRRTGKPAAPPGHITQVSHGARFILAAPLSVFTTTMSRSKRYSEIERVWSALSEQGYAFDVANWNQYVQVQIDQGHVERACQLIANNLLVDGARIYKRTKYQMLKAFEILRDTSSSIQENEPVTDQEKPAATWQRVSTQYPHVLRAVEV